MKRGKKPAKSKDHNQSLIQDFFPEKILMPFQTQKLEEPKIPPLNNRRGWKKQKIPQNKIKPNNIINIWMGNIHGFPQA